MYVQMVRHRTANIIFVVRDFENQGQGQSKVIFKNRPVNECKMISEHFEVIRGPV